MNLKKDVIKVSTEKLDINFKFYLLLKELNSTDGLTSAQIVKFLAQIFTFGKQIKLSGPEKVAKFLELLEVELESIKSEEKRNYIRELLLQIETDVDIKLFSFALKLLSIKSLLLEEAKLGAIVELAESENLNALSLKYDQKSKYQPFYMRVNGALISLLFFDKLEKKDTGFLTQATDDFLKSLVEEFEALVKVGVEPNQIFMLMFGESINQSIKSGAGSSYEDRILSTLIALGINKNEIKKIHDAADSSTEFDFFFTYKGRTFGIGAKRTLRERYKQFIKTVQMSKIDIMIEITLGIDLTEEKAKAITGHSVYLFVADEIYNSRPFLQKIGGVYPASELTLKLLEDLS